MDIELLQKHFGKIGARVKISAAREIRWRGSNAAFVRQGEWFFLPASWLAVDPALALKNEPLSRGAGSKPHMCQYLYRTSGEVVMVCDQYPRGVPQEKYGRILQSNSKAKDWN